MRLPGVFCAVLFVIAMLAGCEKTCTHEYRSELTRPQSCTEDGLYTYTCIHCKDAYTEPIPARGHSYGEGTVETEATYDAEGVMRYICTGCGEIRREAIPKKELPPYQEACTSKA